MGFQRRFIEGLAEKAGIRIGGSEPWDIRVKDPRFFGRIFFHGSLGAGESYMDGDWECDALDRCVERVMRSGVIRTLEGRDLFSDIAQRIFASFANPQTLRRASRVAHVHYDFGNDLFERMLGKTMAYSCAYWPEDRLDGFDLDAAQEAKFDLIARKLRLSPGMRVLDIGSGWGGLARHLADRYGVSCVGLTISREQIDYARVRAAEAGSRVEYELEDYRTYSAEPFDRIVSVGMLEHVGPKNLRTYFETVRRLLRDDGYALIHTIGNNATHESGDPFLEKYIFPGGVLPSMAGIAGATDGHLRLEDWHRFGTCYDATLLAWRDNLRAHWDELRAIDPELYTDRSYRMWEFYLLICAATFRTRAIDLWQMVFSKNIPGVPVYVPVR